MTTATPPAEIRVYTATAPAEEAAAKMSIRANDETALVVRTFDTRDLYPVICFYDGFYCALAASEERGRQILAGLRRKRR